MSTMIDYMQLCRLCLVKEKVNVPIFGDATDVRQLYLKIAACLPVKVSQEDNLPKKICDACLYKVDLFYQFWNTSVNAEKQLIQWLTEIGVDVNIKNSDLATQPLPILPQSHAHPHSMPSETLMLKQERPDMIESQPAVYPLQNQQGLYPAYDNLGYPQPEVSMEVGNATRFDTDGEITKVEEPIEEAPAPKKRGRPPASSKKPAPKRKAPEEVIPARTPATKRRSSAAAAAAAVAAAAAACSDSEEDSDIDDRLEGLGGDDDSDEDDEDDGRVAKEEIDSDSDYVEPTAFVGVPSDPNQDGEQPGPSGLSGAPGKAGSTGTNAATESGSDGAEVTDLEYEKLCHEADKYLVKSVGSNKRVTKHYKCPKCPKIIQYRSKFLAHSFKHMATKTCVCPVCNKLFKSKSSLNVHIKVHDDKIYKCHVCEKEYPHKPSFDFHMKFYKAGSVFPCSKCHRKFHMEPHLVMHIAKDHNNSFTCYSCGEIYSRIDDLLQHVVLHNGISTSTKYQCEFCGKICKGRQSRNSHIKGMHLDAFSVMCDICGKKLASKASLNNHILMHRGEKPLACEHCGKQFLLRNTLNIHRRTHTGEKPHACPYCEKRFTQRNSLVVHIRKHTGDRPFACDLCEEKFVSKNSWKMHRETQHQLI